MNKNTSSNDEVGEEELPYLNCLMDPEVLDWKRGLEHNEIIKISKEQANMPVQISPQLYLSDQNGAHNLERLKELKITHVLNLAGPSAKLEAQIYKKVGKLSCLTSTQTTRKGTQCYRNIYIAARIIFQKCKKVKNGKMVVHCRAGINRSGVIVVAIHMLEEQKNVLDVVRHIRRRRKLFSVERIFQKQLVTLAKKKQLTRSYAKKYHYDA